MSTFAPRPEDEVPLAERLLLDILDTVREPLLVLDPEFRVQRANRAFAQTFDVELDETIGRVLFTLGDGQWDIPPLHELLRDRLTLHPDLQDVEVDHVFPHIGRKVMLLNARVVQQPPHQPRLILLAIEDVTARRTIEHRLAVQRHELERSNAALDEFASVASHELQEPLRKILAFGEMLRNSSAAVLPADGGHALERMLDAAARMRSLVHDVLSFAQVTARMRPFVATDLTRVARQVVTDLDSRIAELAATVEVETLPIVEADPLQMHRLMQNLIGNSLKYRKPDARPIVQVRSTMTDRGVAIITVTDNGIGFKQEYADKIFQMFERLHGRLQYEGSGIGLAICRKIVECHGGTIAATSSPGQGSTFSITLPVTHAPPGYMQ
jgi:signal transduction histidine kinase